MTQTSNAAFEIAKGHTLYNYCDRISRAAFQDGDAMPDSNSADACAHFSGRRVKRDTYRAADGTHIHADLNASANIARKACPDAFTGERIPPAFDNIIVITDPFEQKL